MGEEKLNEQIESLITHNGLDKRMRSLKDN